MSEASRLRRSLTDRYEIVAIKVLHPDLAAALGGERLLAEIKTTAKLQHPHDGAVRKKRRTVVLTLHDLRVLHDDRIQVT